MALLQKVSYSLACLGLLIMTVLAKGKTDNIIRNETTDSNACYYGVIKMPQFSHIFPCTKRYLVVSALCHAVTFSPSPRVPRQEKKETFSANSWLNTGISSTAAHLGTSELLLNHVL